MSDKYKEQNTMKASKRMLLMAGVSTRCTCCTILPNEHTTISSTVSIIRIDLTSCSAVFCHFNSNPSCHIILSFNATFNCGKCYLDFEEYFNIHQYTNIKFGICFLLFDAG